MITADPLHMQRGTTRHNVEEKAADCVFTVNEIQKTLYQNIEALLVEDFSPSVQDRRERSWTFGNSEH